MTEERHSLPKASANCQGGGKINNTVLSIEDEWPTFGVRYSHLILPLSPRTVALTDYTWQGLDGGRWQPGVCARSGETNT